MARKWFTIGILVSILLLAACSGNQAANQPTPQPTEEQESTPNPSKEESPADESPAISDQTTDDLAIFAQTLRPSGQQGLNSLPEASVYHITLKIPEEMSQALTGTLEVRYFNQENVPLEEIYFRLFPNFYQGTLRTDEVQVNGLPVETQLKSGSTALQVNLAQALDPGESVMITMNYELILPETMGGNYGLLGYFDDILVLDTFYPMIPAYDENGWYAHYPYQNGDLTYTDASFYLVEVSAPADLVIASSGSAVEQSEQDGWQQLTIAAGPARDFYLAGSKYFSVMTADYDGITVNSYALKQHAAMQEMALSFAGQALQIFSDLFGDYPYTEFDVLSSPMLALGIEYPGITGIYLGMYDVNGSTYGISNRNLLESAIAHEVGHQWFYNSVGSDQQSEPWVDEALVQYITYQYYEKQYGDGAGAGMVQSWVDRWARVANNEMPIGLIASDYGDSAYSPIVYGRGPFFYLELEQQWGEEVLLDGLKDFAMAYQWKLANTEDVRKSLEATCNCDLSEMFEFWVYPVE